MFGELETKELTEENLKQLQKEIKMKYNMEESKYSIDKPQVDLKEIKKNYNEEIFWTVEFYIYMIFVLLVISTLVIMIHNGYYDDYYNCINDRVIRQL